MKVIGPIAIGNVIEDARELTEILESSPTWKVSMGEWLGPHEFYLDRAGKYLFYGSAVHADMKREMAYRNN